MTLSQDQLEWIVREVVQRLNAGANEATSKQPTTVQCSELKLCDRVVTTRTLDGRISGISALRIDPRAIVTPAARDLLAEHCVTLLRGDSKAASAPTLVGLRTQAGRDNCNQCCRF